MFDSEKAMAPHSSTLAWKIPWMEEPGRPKSMGSLRVGHDWATSLSLFTFKHWRRKWQPTPVLLPGKSHGRRSLVGCSPWGRWGLDMTERLLFSQNRNNSKEFIDKGRSAEIRTEIKLEVILIFPGRNQSTFIKIISPLTSLSHGINPWEGKSGG